MALGILICSISMQFWAAALAFRLVRKTGRIPAWLFIATALLLMGVRRTVTLVQTLPSGLGAINPVAEGVALLISLLMLIGVWTIGRVFERLNHLQQLAQDELERRRQAEVAVRSNERQLRLLTDNMVDVVSQTNPEHVIVYCSPPVERVFGIRPEDIIGHSLYERVYPEDAERVREQLLAAISSRRESLQMELRILHNNGDYVWVESSVRLLYGEDGEYTGAVLSSRNITLRKRTEEALIRSEALLKKSQAIGHVGSWELHLASNRLTWSDEVYRIFGLCPEERAISYETFLEAVHPDDRDTVNAAYMASLREGRGAYEVEHRVVRRDNGEVRFVLERCEHVRDTEGSVMRSVGMVQDITDRKRVEMALADSERNYREIFNGTQDSICIHDPETGAILDVNHGLLDMYGYSREEALRISVNDLSFGSIPYDLDHALERIRRAIAEGTQTFEWLARKKGGEIFWVEVVLKGTVIGGRDRVLAVVRDVTERKHAQEALRQKEEYYRSLIENAMDIVTIMSADGTILYESPSVERIAGYGPDELPGVNLFTLLHPEDAGPAREVFDRLVRNPGTLEANEFRFRHKDGSWRIIAAVGKNLLEVPAVGAVVVNMRDVTERREAERQLRISLREKEVLLKEVHHRVKNNLQVISSLLDLQSRTVENPEALEVFKDSKQRVRAMALIHERLYGTGDLSNIQLSGYVEDLVHSIVKANRPDGSVTVHFEVSPILLSVNAAVPCSLIINELVSNCLKHAFTKGQAGHIVVDFRSLREGTMTLVIEDDGAGLPPRFDINEVRSLGLTIVKTLVRQLNGIVEVERKAGARFRIVFADRS